LPPIDILYCIDRLDRGGTETQLAGLLARLDRRRFRPHLCTLKGRGELAGEVDCPGPDLGMDALVRPGSPARLRRLEDYIRRHRVALVQTFFQDASVAGMFAAGRAGVPVRLVALRDMGFWRTPKQVLLMRWAFGRATGFVANSAAVADLFGRRDRLPAGRFTIIPNGIDPAAIPFVERGGGPPTVGLVGNLNRKVKRADVFLRAAARLAARRPEISWHLVGDGRLRPGYEALAAKLGLGKRAVFAGRVTDVPAYLQRLTVGVNCSDSEGFANAVLEYMLGGCAVVASAVGGNLEVVRPGETGLLFPPGNHVALAGAVAELLDDRERREAMTRRAREVVAADYGWDRCVAAHEECYARALADAGVS